jgi:hypothetical protein
VEKIHPMTASKWKKSTVKRFEVEKIHHHTPKTNLFLTFHGGKNPLFRCHQVEKIHFYNARWWKKSTSMLNNGGKNPP